MIYLPECLKELHFYISNLKQSKQTALYYAMRRGYESIEEYVSTAQSDPEFNFNGSFLVTFTDGLDNASLDPKIGVPANGENNPYYQYVKNMLSSKKIGGIKVRSYMIALEGNDVTDWNAFTTPLKKLADDNQFFSAKYGQFDEVQNAFRNIASNLVQQWMDLNCYINPGGFTGRCRWVLRCNDEPEPEPEPEPAPAPKVTSKPYKKSVGIIAGNLLGLSYKYVSPYKKYAYQMDLGGRFVSGDDKIFSSVYIYYFSGWSLEMNHNFLYQDHIKRWDDYCLDFFLGGGFSFGGLFGGSEELYENNIYQEGYASNLGIKFGLNAMLGMEFMFERIPLSLQLDFRPGYGFYYNFGNGNIYPAFFDYAIAASVRYTW